MTTPITSVPSLAALRALTPADREGVLLAFVTALGRQMGWYQWDGLDGAGLADDSSSFIRPDDLTDAENGGWFAEYADHRDKGDHYPAAANRAGFMTGPDKVALDALAEGGALPTINGSDVLAADDGANTVTIGQASAASAVYASVATGGFIGVLVNSVEAARVDVTGMSAGSYRSSAANPASAGTVRCSNAENIACARNAGNTANIRTLRVDGSDKLILGDAAAAAGGFTPCTQLVITTPTGALVAVQTGTFYVDCSTWNWRAADTTQRMAWTLNAAIIGNVASGGSLAFQYNSTTRLSFDSTGLGFYAHAPVALQTGVAVTAAGIHAALVNLGLITA